MMNIYFLRLLKPIPIKLKSSISSFLATASHREWNIRDFYLRFTNKLTLSGSDLPYHLVGVPPHSTSPIPQGTFSTFGLTLSHGRNICFYFAEVSARKSSETASTCDARKYLYYRPKLLFFSQLDNFLVQYNFGKVRFINLSNKLIHLQVQKRNCQRYPDSRMELVALSGS